MYFESDEEANNRVVEWMNSAAIVSSVEEKVKYLNQVQEVILNTTPHLLLNYLNDLLAYAASRENAVRSWVVHFLDEACKKNERVFEIVIPTLQLLFNDNCKQVRKCVIQACTNVYKSMLIWLAKSLEISDAMEEAWNRFSNIKMQILNLIDDENEGIRNFSVKFLETVIVLQTYSGITTKKLDQFSLEDIPLTLKFARRRKLEEEALQLFALLLKYLGSSHMDKSNLLITITTLCNIIVIRPVFFSRVLDSFEMLLVDLPPRLQIVKKHLKRQLSVVIRHPSSIDHQQKLIQLLTELGCNQQEILKMLPKKFKRLLEQNAQSVASKKAKYDINKDNFSILDEDSNNHFEEEEDIKPDLAQIQVTDLVGENEKFIFENLTTENATEIVLAHMCKLPTQAPTYFLQNYKPSNSLNSSIKTISKLMALQFAECGIDPTTFQMTNNFSEREKAIVKGNVTIKTEDITFDNDVFGNATIKQETEDDEEKYLKSIEQYTNTTITTSSTTSATKQNQRLKVKSLKLDIVKPFSRDMREENLIKAVQRILTSDSYTAKAKVERIHEKIETVLASSFMTSVRETVLNYILNDLKSRFDMALSWLFYEYSILQGFNRNPSLMKKNIKPDQSYNNLLCTIITHLGNDNKEKELLNWIFYVAPLITDEAIELLKRFCMQETRACNTMELIYEVIVRRPPKKLIFTNILLYYTSFELDTVRDQAIKFVLKLYQNEKFVNLNNTIEEYAIVYLGFLTQPNPPPILFGEDRGRPEFSEKWSDDICKACLYLFLTLIPFKKHLIHNLAKVYTQTTPEIKRVIFKMIDGPIKSFDTSSEEILELIDSCEKGCETLVTRIVHILTEKDPPTPELVNKVRDVYQTRIQDVRFLIPVLTGLTKKEVLIALPKLIKLNPNVIKEVFNRLFTKETILTPSELLVALHTIDQTKADLKTIIKATTLCFGEKQIFTQEVFAVAIQQMMELNPLPTLLMRTVIQSLSQYPKLSGFVMNVLHRLILKQVWKYKVAWEGFTKCCLRMKPQSFQILLQLPSQQLAEALQQTPELRAPLVSHVSLLTEQQKIHINPQIMEVLNQQPLQIMNLQTPPPAPIVVDNNVDLVNDAPKLIEPLPPGMD